MSSEFGSDYGLVHEAIVTGRKVGAGKDFWAALAHSEELFGKVVAFVAEALRVVFTLVAKIDRDMTGWKLLEPVPAEEGEFEPTIHEFLKDEDNGRCGGEEMLKRAKEQGISSGLCHLEAMLRKQEKIPVEERKHVLVSTEVWQSPSGCRFVWCLCCHGARWCLLYYWLRNDFGSNYRLVGSRKYQKLLDS